MKLFMQTHKKLLALAGIFVILLITCFIIEAVTKHDDTSKNVATLKNNFIFQPQLFLATLYSIGLMLCAIIPIGLVKMYRGHLAIGATDDQDWIMMTQIAFSILVIGLIAFLIGTMTDYFFFSKLPIVFTIILGICIILYKLVAIIMVTLAICWLIITIFQKWTMPVVGDILGSAWGIGIIGFVCLVFLLATCNGIKSTNTNVIDPFEYGSQKVIEQQKAAETPTQAAPTGKQGWAKRTF